MPLESLALLTTPWPDGQRYDVTVTLVLPGTRMTGVVITGAEFFEKLADLAEDGGNTATEGYLRGKAARPELIEHAGEVLLRSATVVGVGLKTDLSWPVAVDASKILAWHVDKISELTVPTLGT